MSLRSSGLRAPPSYAKIARRANQFFLSSPFAKKISVAMSGKSSLQAGPVLTHRGALRNVNNAGWDAVDADGAIDERRLRRTAKSCGSDASTPASSQRWQHHWRR